jgi:hypothetical protein
MQFDPGLRRLDNAVRPMALNRQATGADQYLFPATSPDVWLQRLLDNLLADEKFYFC